MRYWAHAGLVTTGTEKMAHSLENFTTIADVLDVYEPMAVRLFLLQTHYRSAILYSREGFVTRFLDAAPFGQTRPREIGLSGSPSIWSTLPSRT